MAFPLYDEVIGSVIPVAVYWIYSGIFVILGDKLDNYRLHSKAEEDAKNIVSKWTVVKGVLIQQAVQIVVSVLLLAVKIYAFFLTSAPTYIRMHALFQILYLFDTYAFACMYIFSTT